jgi:hypothetical protein
VIDAWLKCLDNPGKRGDQLPGLLSYLDFTLEQYARLCRAIKGSKYQVLTMRELLECSSQEGHLLIMRHDVDEDARNALDMARVEHDLGIRATYYFRVRKRVFVPAIIDEIALYGHEIGYHYETLDKTRGKTRRALSLFAAELAMLRERYEIKTACMHGNPLTKYDNKKIWENCELGHFDLIGEPYLSLDYNQFLYLSDSGRTWLGDKNKVKDRVSSINMPPVQVKHTGDLIELITGGGFEKICILTHPKRWSKNLFNYLTYYFIDLAYNAGKKVTGVMFLL